MALEKQAKTVAASAGSAVEIPAKKTSSKNEVFDFLSGWVVGQKEPLKKISSYLEIAQANLAPAGKPAGIFLLLGPTGVGKTETAQAVAAYLHNSPRQVLRIDCGEYQLDHEVAKLIGAPPGYLGHRETQAILTQQQLANVTSDKSNLSVVLFDEIEKASPSMTRILLGILDKAFLRTGDNNPVNFENCLIFLTSNLGYQEFAATQKAPGFVSGVDERQRDKAIQAALKKRFAPEFLNRIDEQLFYQSLSKDTMRTILDQQLEAFQTHLDVRKRLQTVYLYYTRRAYEFLLDAGFSTEWGARELKRVIQRHVAHPVALALLGKKLMPSARIEVDITEKRGTTFKVIS